MYRATMAFRIKSGCENVLNTYTEPVVARRFFPWGFLGLDKEGNAILMERIGRIDLIGMHASLGQEEFLRWVVWYHEVQERSSRRVSALMGKDRMKLTVIIDLGGLSMRYVMSHCGSAALSAPCRPLQRCDVTSTVRFMPTYLVFVCPFVPLQPHVALHAECAEAPHATGGGQLPGG